MARLFLILAGLNGFALAAAFVVGMVSKFSDLDLYVAHFSLGLITAVATLLVHCIIFTYFLGTGRWVKEVGLAYQLPDENYPRATRELKRRTFPPALAAMLITIATAAAGAGADQSNWPWQVHFSLAATTIGVNLWAYCIEYRDLRLNAKIMEGVLAQVDQIRAERGLPSNTEALRRQ